uniref:Hexamerin n=1 Tax=Clastoptera arizonana TaxID=38151 RepID=A0A1B6DNJ4_9HEMI
MKAVLILLLVAGAHLVLASQHVADKNFLKKQRQVLQLVKRQPDPSEDQNNYANSYDPLQDLANYNNPQVVEHFVNQYNLNNTLLSKNKIFNFFCYHQYEEAIQLFEVFYYAKEFETFYKVANYARARVNFGIYLFALGAAVYQRPDAQGLVFPQTQEIYPQGFVSVQALRQLEYAKERGETSAVFLVNYTGNYPTFENYDRPLTENSNYPYEVEEYSNHASFYNDQDNQESYLSYFREDGDLNAFAARFSLQNPNFYNSTKYGKQDKFNKYGEKVIYVAQQILARYNLERFSNYIPSVKPINFDRPLNPGYNSQLQYGNGKFYPARPNNLYLGNSRNHDIQTLKKIETRFRDSIDSGFFFGEGGRKIQLTAENGGDILGKLFASFGDSPTKKYYGFENGLYGYFDFLREIIAQSVDPEHEYSTPNGVVGNPITQLRDPLMYQALAQIIQIYNSYKNRYQPYKQEEVSFPGAKILSVDIDKLVTYFEPYEFELYNAFAYSQHENQRNFNYKARQLRLNNKPFLYNIKVNSNKDIESVIRVFIGPKYNAKGQEFTLQQAKNYFFQLDQFYYSLKNGDNNIKRNFREGIKYADQSSTSELYKKVNLAEQGGSSFYYDDLSSSYAGFPARLVLPKGKKSGYPLVFIVVISPYTSSNTNDYQTAFASDQRPYGFPFDRRIDEQVFQNAPNIFFKDVNVFQKRFSEVN